VGKRNLEQAMRKFAPKLNFNVNWKPFYLHGNKMAPEGMGLADYIYRVYGMRITVDDPNSALNQAGRRVGIEFNNTRRMVNTDDSHRLIELGKELGKGDEMIEKIFHEYFENAANISDREVLVRLGSEVLGDKLTPDQLREFFASDKHIDTVTEQLRTIRGISGVPHFTIYVPNSKRKISVSGAQPPERFEDMFEDFLD